MGGNDKIWFVEKVLNCTQLWEGSLVPTHTHTHTLCVLDHGWWCHLARKEEMMGPEDSFLWWGHKRRCMAFLSLTFSSLFWCDLSLHMYIDACVISSWSISYIYIIYIHIKKLSSCLSYNNINIIKVHSIFPFALFISISHVLFAC